MTAVHQLLAGIFAAAVALGAMAQAVACCPARRESSLRHGDSASERPKQAAGPAMTGAGAVTLGCTVGDGMSGIAAGSLGSMRSVAALFTGAAFVMWAEGARAGTGRRCAAGA